MLKEFWNLKEMEEKRAELNALAQVRNVEGGYR